MVRSLLSKKMVIQLLENVFFVFVAVNSTFESTPIPAYRSKVGRLNAFTILTNAQKTLSADFAFDKSLLLKALKFSILSKHAIRRRRKHEFV